jgi:hypothetical protein
MENEIWGKKTKRRNKEEKRARLFLLSSSP